MFFYSCLIIPHACNGNTWVPKSNDMYLGSVPLNRKPQESYRLDITIFSLQRNYWLELFFSLRKYTWLILNVVLVRCYIQQWRNLFWALFAFARLVLLTNSHMWCDQAKSVGSRKYWLWDIAKQRKYFLLFPFVLETL